ncbi:MAG: DNA polymerase I [Candidatus Lernaella stagnicola]|nr:DNA polymerase I [Candidatus Lernaella stagnicola]
MAEPRKRLLLIDGSGYIFRAFFAIPTLSNSQDLPTNAVYGVATMLDKTLRDLQPDSVAVCFDTKEKTFRHERYPEYKANRPEPPEELVPQFPLIHELVELRGLPCLAVPGYEADDVIGTLARQGAAHGFEVVLVSGDKDLMQLVGENVTMYDPMKDIWYDHDGVVERFGVEPGRVIEVLGLAGDSSDNIPGVPGVGPKTALKLLKEYGDIAGVLARAEEIKGKLGERLRENAGQAELSRELATIHTEVPLDIGVAELQPRPPDLEKLREFYTRLEFRKLLDELSGPATNLSRDHYETVLTGEALAAMCETLRRAGGFAFDTETTSQFPMRAELVGLSFCADDEVAYYVPVAHSYLGVPKQLPVDEVLAAVGPLLSDPDLPKWAQNAKYDIIVLARAGVTVRGLAGDTMIADYLLAAGRGGHGLDAMALRYLGHTTIKFDEVTGKGKSRKLFSEVDTETATQYAAEDAHVTWLLKKHLETEMQADPATVALYRDLEIMLIDVLVAMERRGVAIDSAFFKQLSTEMDKRIQAVTAKIHEAAGTTFNLNSPSQIAEVLFERLGIKPLRKTKKGFSTDAAVLETLAEQGHEVPRLMLEYRSLAKLKGTYVDALPRLVHPVTGRIHTSFNQTIAATGRLSSSNPNLQNIPIRTEEGRRIREGFIPAPGKVLLAADYSQVELRLAAHLSGDETMIAAFHSGEDIHRRTAAEILGVMPGLVSPQERAMAKTVNFGVLYGMSAFRLAHDLAISTKKAKAFIDNYFARYPKLRAYLDGVIAEARERGFVQTILGRKRPLPNINSHDRQAQAGAERAAINTPVQGSAADLIKLAMLALHRRIEREELPLAMILQVHDELVFEVEEDAVDKYAAIVKAEMEGVMELSVPLVVDIGTGRNWGEAH